MTYAQLEQETGHKKTDLRIVKTHRLIKDAFRRLLAREEYTKITVTAVANEAQINRKTFYAHFNSVEDLLASFLHDQVSEIFANSDVPEEGEPPEGRIRRLTRLFLEALEHSLEIEENLLRNVPITWLVDQMRKPLCEKVAQIRRDAERPVNERMEYYIDCYVTCILSTFLLWRERVNAGNDSETIDDLVDIVMAFVSGKPEAEL